MQIAGSNLNNMLKVSLGLFFLSIGAAVSIPTKTRAQGTTTRSAEPVRAIPLRADSWAFQPGTVEFLPAAPTIASVTPQGPAMKILSRGGGAVVVKNADFSEGTIDFDMVPTDSNFASFHFHRQDTNEFESVYLRTSWAAGQPEIMEAVQYTPTMKGISCWNLMPHYQGNAAFRMDAWNHFRIIIAGRQMLVYINSESHPTLAIPRLEGNSSHGPFAFEGQMTVAHLVVRPGPVTSVGWLSGPEGFDPTDNDPRYLRHWQVTQPGTILPGVDFGKNLMPGGQTTWSPITAERRGLVNLTRVFGGNRQFKGDPPRRIVWLKTTLRADREWNYRMRLGFTNDVWVFLNGRYLYVDKNYYDEPSMKSPRGRVSIENCSFDLPLKAGANELLIGVGNDFFGWGIVARLDDNLGVKMEGAGD
jgi:hypothetical protein